MSAFTKSFAGLDLSALSLQRQPIDSGVCGQLCVAMLMGSTLASVCDLVGHRHGTTYEELRDAVVSLGGTCADFVEGEWRIANGVVVGVPAQNALVIMRNTIDPDGAWRHWSLIKSGLLIDPALGYHDRSFYDRGRRFWIEKYAAVTVP